jgi:hypothetical protein
MQSLMLWLNLHRVLVAAIVAAISWVSAYAYFFNPQVRNYLRLGQPHSWSVDVVSKTSKARGKVES